jgi:hypothetical protein
MILLDHGGAAAEHVHLRELQLLGPRGHHRGECLLHQRLVDRGRIGPAQRVQAPEGEDHRDLVAHRHRPVGDDEGREHRVEVAGEDDERLLLPQPGGDRVLEWDASSRRLAGRRARLDASRQHCGEAG